LNLAIFIVRFNLEEGGGAGEAINANVILAVAKRQRSSPSKKQRGRRSPKELCNG
jgi:hypothetical protein